MFISIQPMWQETISNSPSSNNNNITSSNNSNKITPLRPTPTTQPGTSCSSAKSSILLKNQVHNHALPITSQVYGRRTTIACNNVFYIARCLHQIVTKFINLFPSHESQETDRKAEIRPFSRGSRSMLLTIYIDLCHVEKTK